MKLYIANEVIRKRALDEVRTMPLGYSVDIQPPKRTLDQNARFHAICGELAGRAWGGRPRTDTEWKALLVSGHAVATKQEAEIVEGLEGEVVALRESTATMSKQRSTSLLDYAESYREAFRAVA